MAAARPPPALTLHPNWYPVAGEENLARWASLDAAALHQEDARTANLIGVPMRIGVNRPWPEGAAGLWEGQRPREDSGRFLWTHRLNAPGAKAMRVHFARFGIPVGGELILADHAGRTVEVFAGDGREDFWSAPVPGNLVYLEYRSPVGETAVPAIEIDQISHIYRDPLMPSEPGENGGGVPQPQSFSCQLDVNCYTVPPSVRNAVGRLIYTTQSGTFKCTGTLLADSDPNTYAGYLLTANHCINSPAAAASLTVYWFYQTDVCNGTVPALESLPRSDGSTLLATSTNSDFTLLRLWDDPHDGQGFAAWTTNSPSPGDTLASIHHPLGEHKRVSVGALTSSEPICGSYPPSRFWYVDWTTGITESGSSGGPLFNSSWQVVGQLYGTCSINTPSCTNSDDYNVLFGKFGLTYPAIASHLGTVTPDDTYEDNDVLARAAAIPVGTNALRLVDFDDYFSVTLGAPAAITATATFDTGNLDLDLELLTASGGVLSASAGTTGTEMVTTNVPAGRYILRATKRHNWGGTYTLVLSVEPNTTCPDPPVITCPPNVVTNTTAGQCFASGVALGTPVVTDDCGVASLTNNAPAQFAVGTNMVTWTATDIHGNRAQCQQRVVVVDAQPPALTAPPDIITFNNAGQCCAAGLILGKPVVSDNCGVSSVTNNAPSKFPIGTNQVIWTVRDIHGNATQRQQRVVVFDRAAPPLRIVNIRTIAGGDLVLNFTCIGSGFSCVLETAVGDVLTWRPLAPAPVITPLGGGLFAARFRPPSTNSQAWFRLKGAYL